MIITDSILTRLQQRVHYDHKNIKVSYESMHYMHNKLVDKIYSITNITADNDVPYGAILYIEGSLHGLFASLSTQNSTYKRFIEIYKLYEVYDLYKDLLAPLEDYYKNIKLTADNTETDNDLKLVFICNRFLYHYSKALGYIYEIYGDLHDVSNYAILPETMEKCTNLYNELAKSNLSNIQLSFDYVNESYTDTFESYKQLQKSADSINTQPLTLRYSTISEFQIDKLMSHIVDDVNISDVNPYLSEYTGPTFLEISHAIQSNPDTISQYNDIFKDPTMFDKYIFDIIFQGESLYKSLNCVQLDLDIHSMSLKNINTSDDNHKVAYVVPTNASDNILLAFPYKGYIATINYSGLYLTVDNIGQNNAAHTLVQKYIQVPQDNYEFLKCIYYCRYLNALDTLKELESIMSKVVITRISELHSYILTSLNSNKPINILEDCFKKYILQTIQNFKPLYIQKMI